MKIIKKILLLLFIVFVLAQFFGPEKNQGDIATTDAFMEETNPPDEVVLVLKQACFDCHSDFTRYPWYNNITPVNFWLKGHIDHGKEELNFSEWNSYSVKRKDRKIEEIIEMVKKKEMPLPSYTWTHKDAILSDTQVQSVKEWAEKVRLSYQLSPKPE
jgi:hypothetical protein